MHYDHLKRNRSVSLGSLLGLLGVVILFQLSLAAHQVPSVHDIVANVRERLSNAYPLEELNDLAVDEIVKQLTPEERRVLGTRHIRFEVNCPVWVYVFLDSRFTEKSPLDPFWIEEQGFVATDYSVRCRGYKYIAYKKEFPAGIVGLGVNSLSGDHSHYMVALAPVDDEDTVEVLNAYPAYQTVGTLEKGVNAYTDAEIEPVKFISSELSGLTLLRVDPWRHRDARLSCIYTETRYPADKTPDQLTLTWSDDPKTTQTIQWRTDITVKSGVVAFSEKSGEEGTVLEGAEIVQAETKELYTPRVLNNQRVHRHTVTLTGLKPGTTYLYAIGATADSVGDMSGSFTTAPGNTQPFSFVYMGDAQNGLDFWGKIVRRAAQDKPEAVFCLIAGDLVNRGSDRDDWDDFFYNAGNYFTCRPLVPAIGNHEYHLSDGRLLYNDVFTLLKNGPDTIPPQHAYSFEYSNALFVILDSNQSPQQQVAWLDETLGSSDATWKFVSFHHPIYSSSPKRDNPIHRMKWMPVFDKYHVDMVLQGHDHAYLRTFPMKNDERVDTPAKGTVYVVSVSGTKMYDLGEFDYADKAFADTSTYQAIDIEIDGNRLVYKAHDVNGNCVDEVIIEK